MGVRVAQGCAWEMPLKETIFGCVLEESVLEGTCPAGIGKVSFLDTEPVTSKFGVLTGVQTN